MKKGLMILLASLLVLAMALPALAGECTHRGLLDTMFCDNDKDLVADDAAEGECKDPSTLVFTYTPVEDPAVYQDLFSNFQEYLEKATGKKVVYITPCTPTPPRSKPCVRAACTWPASPPVPRALP